MARQLLLWLSANPQDAVFLNDVSEVEPAIPWIASRASVVLVVHDEGRRYVSPVLRWSPWLAAVVGVSGHIASVIRRRTRFREEKIRVIHNGTSFPPPPEGRRWVPGGVVRLLYAGGIDFVRKGVQDLPRIAGYLRRRGRTAFRLTVIGGRSPRLEREFRRARVAERVSLPGRLARCQVFEMAGRHDILLLPSRSESFGMVTIEAMSMGCVPVAYDVPAGTLEIVSDGVTGYLAPFPSWRAMARLVERLGASPETLERLGRAAVRETRQRFTSEAAAAGYLGLVRDIADRRVPVDVPVESGAVPPSRGRIRRAPVWRPWIRRLARPLLERSPRLVRWVWPRWA